MSVDGQTVPHGIAAHAKSIIEFNLPAGSTRFRAFAALDDGATVGVKVAGTRVGCGRILSSFVWMVKNLAESCETATSATPYLTNSAVTWSVVTLVFLNWTSQTVPPV